MVSCRNKHIKAVARAFSARTASAHIEKKENKYKEGVLVSSRRENYRKNNVRPPKLGTEEYVYLHIFNNYTFFIRNLARGLVQKVS